MVKKCCRCPFAPPAARSARLRPARRAAGPPRRRPARRRIARRQIARRPARRATGPPAAPSARRTRPVRPPLVVPPPRLSPDHRPPLPPAGPRPVRPAALPACPPTPPATPPVRPPPDRSPPRRPALAGSSVSNRPLPRSARPPAGRSTSPDSSLCKILKVAITPWIDGAEVWIAKRVFFSVAVYNFKRGNWLRLMPSRNGVLKKRMPIL